jgi:hypothetical protein
MVAPHSWIRSRGADAKVMPTFWQLRSRRTFEEDEMARIIRCECGHVARGDSDEAVVTAIRPGPWKACSSARVSIPARRWCATAMPLLAFWLMKLYRHADVRVLDCSRRAWTNDERPWTTDAPTPNPTTRYPLLRRMPAFGPTMRLCGRRSTAVADVRSLAEFQGERFWPSGAPEPSGRAGHIPSAIHLPIDNVHDERGRFRSVDELRQQFAPIAASRSATSSPTAPSAAEPPSPGSC